MRDFKQTQCDCCRELYSESVNMLEFLFAHAKLELLCNKYGNWYTTPTLSFPSVVQSQYKSPALKVHLLAATLT